MLVKMKGENRVQGTDKDEKKAKNKEGKMEPQRHRVTEYNKDYKFKEKKLTGEIIAAAMEVHRNLGPGLLESAYEECLCHELHLKDIPFERQKPLPLVYKEIKLDCGYRMDLVVDNKVIIEIKCVEEINPVHKAQLLTYLKLYDKQVGLIINFYKPLLKNGIKRLVL